MRKLLASVRDFFASFSLDLHPACPICGRIVYVKTMPLHLSFEHRSDDPDVIAWRERGAPRRWTPPA